MDRLRLEGRLVFGKDHRRQVQIKKYLTEVYEPLRSVLSTPAKLGKSRLKKLLGADAAARYPHPKPMALIERLMISTGYEDALVLDPFAGSGTTADAVLRRNALDGGRRRFILIEEGTPSDPYCRTLTAPRVQAAIKDHGLRSGFTFLETGQSLNREAILELERRAIASLIIQSDVTGAARGITRLDGEHVIGFNARREGICLRWNGRADSTISAGVLSEMFAEAKRLKLNKPIRVYGSTCTVGETESFRFCQIPDEIMAALNLDDEEPANLNDIAENVETLETATIP